ncbi:MAG: SRPBCC family protein [Oceanicaulis sp.]|uniref:SRPBCC family protein n=1 Tax=Glycocaulis sp. TaxID=1969725 RepID=UPI0025C0F491|nr:SRPBCC family protein [Glycocaulis sp.]MCC5981598.1 SRPBCC family protein [Oceanicaulis sp.]MCH8522546.1 SRPBCC family protein [Glycocaulis sp.]
MKRPKPNPSLDLEISRFIDAPVALVWEAWTNPEHFKKWWTPRPWQTVAADMVLRPGGLFRTVMRSPEGKSFDHKGMFIDVQPERLIAFTDALDDDWRPTSDAFFTALIYFEPEGDGTRYTAYALHKDEAGCKRHVEMGFHEGWGSAFTQLEEVVAGLKATRA